VGTAAAPAYSFRGDTDTGMYRYGTNSLGFATSGANRMFMNTSGIFANIGIYPGTTNTHPLGNTTYRWNAIWIATQADGGKINMGNNDTIEYDDSNNEFKFYMDGTLRTILGQNATRFSGAILYYTAMATFSSGGYATLRRRDSDGRILELTSHPKYKKNIRRAPQALKRAKALAKSANTKHWEDADDEDGESAAGLLSTDVAEHWPEAIRWDPEDPTVAKGIHYEMLVAPLLELVADLEQRVNDLERGR